MTALLLSWTGAWTVLWGALFGALLGGLASFGVVTSWSVSHHLYGLGTGEATTIVSVFLGVLLGFLAGSAFTLASVLSMHLLPAVVSVACGAIIAFIVVLCNATAERAILRLRGYRRLSRREVRRVAPLVRDIADAMALSGLPRFAMADNLVPNAWAHMRTVVLTTGLLQVLDDDELTAVLAHELHHWHFGDAVGQRVIWAAALPLAILLNFGAWIGGVGVIGVGSQESRSEAEVGRQRPQGVLAMVGWLISWAPRVITEYVLVPVSAATQRRYEYEADAAAAAIGHASGLSSALRKLEVFEGGRTGWERAMTATHPPTELRIEALDAPRADDLEYQESGFSLPTFGELIKIIRSLTQHRHRKSRGDAPTGE